MRATILVVLAAASLLALTPGAAATIELNPPAVIATDAILVDPTRQIMSTYGGFNSASAVALSDEDHGLGFPTWGSDYIILSTGEAGAPNSPVGTDHQMYHSGTNVYDPASLEIELDVPQGANCIWFAFRFVTDDWWSDSFIAEIDTTDYYWDDTTSTLSAPANFALDEFGSPVGSAALGMVPGNTGTTGMAQGSNLLYAATQVTPGPHVLYLTIFDVGDNYYDSQVYIDGLDMGNVDPEFCVSGQSFAPVSPVPELGTFLLAAGGLAVAAVVVGRKLR